MKYSLRIALTAMTLLFSLLFLVSAVAEPAVRGDDFSLFGQRRTGIVPQSWDQSCGSAALSTILTYYLQAPVDETSVINDMLLHGDPIRVREAGGFSLLDLKRYAQRHGFHSEGYGGLTVSELAEFRRAAIVPVRARGYDHFVVFVRLFGDRVILADPAWGNVSLTIRQFNRLWQNGIALLIFSLDQEAQVIPRKAPPFARLSDVQRRLRGMGTVPPLRVRK